MTFGTVCDGIGCGHLAFVQAGFDCAWSFEIEAFPSAVLAYRFPGVKNHGDMNAAIGLIERGEIEAPDVFIGGTPCQAFSVAGKRKGLEDARGNLSLTFCGIADAIDAVRGRDGKPPCAVAWENVPGVLSDKGNAFGCFLGALSGSGCELRPPGGRWGNAGCVFGSRRTVAWRTLDSQFFGVAQRRRRVFVVASAGDGFRPEEVLFESQGVRRDSPPSREAGQGFTHDVVQSLVASGRGVGRTGETRGQDPVVAVHTTGAGYWREGVGTLRAREQDSHENLMVMAHGQANAEIAKDVCPTLNCDHEASIATYDMRGHGDGVTVGTLTGDHAGRPTDYTPVVVFSHCDNGRDASDGVVPALRARGGKRVDGSCGDAGNGNLAVAILSGGEVCRTLSARHDSSPCADRGQEVVAIQDVRGMDKAQNGRGYNADGTAYTVDAMATQGVAVAFEPSFVRTSGGQPSENLNPCLRADTNTGDGQPCVATTSQVRRLLPSECEALQALPPGWTRIPWRGKTAEDCPDGPRYKGIGNGQTVSVMRWLADRIKAELEP